ERKKTQKFVFRSALRPNQISFSHGQNPTGTLPPRRAATKSCPELIGSCLSRLPVKPGRQMQQIGDWLKKLGMSEYAERFAENRIDLSVLPELTDQHLKDLGIALGDRLKMLRAIRELPGAGPASPKFVITESEAQDTAERRQVTVLCSDLVGS